jgi:hypothetical protein
LDEVLTMAKQKNTTATAQVMRPSPNTFMPPMSGEENKGPKLETCEVGPFRLKGVKVDVNQYTAEQVTEMIAWARDNDAYVVEDKGLFSWKSEAKRDWFILRWS